MLSQEKCKHTHTTGLIFQFLTTPKPCYLEKCFQCKKIIKKILVKNLTKPDNFYIL